MRSSSKKKNVQEQKGKRGLMKRTAKEAEVINLDLPAKEEYLVIVRSVTSLVCQRIDFSEQKEEDAMIAIGEVFINAIKHAYRNTHNYINRTSIRFLHYPEKLVIVIKDFGRGFDPYFVSMFVKRDDIEQPERVGLGIFLIKALMDEVEYDSSLTGGTQVRLTKYK